MKNVSDSVHHWTPKVHSMGKASRLKSNCLMPSALSETGICSITSFWFDVNLWRLNPPCLHISLMSLTRLTASSVDNTDFKPSSTQKLGCSNSAAVELISASLSSAVPLRAKQPGDDEAQNRWTTVIYSWDSFDVLPFSHQRKHDRSLCYTGTLTW